MAGRRRRRGAGRKPKPDATKQIAGNPGKRPLSGDAGGVTPIRGYPEAPDFLDARQLEVWHQLAPEIHDLGLLAPAYGGSFLCLVLMRVRLERAVLRCRKSGHYAKGVGGKMVRAPWAIEWSECGREFARLCSEFGLTPSAVTRVTPVRKGGKAIQPDAPEKTTTARGRILGVKK